ncbi:hypothetical protein K488DRAFT_41187 [Vararia minispora EC-137]|uniref:Uncharacterized protein n=1 Tax=Vararia minispora EC-137 TaxID=1314806 RepID=A0ACB8QXB6_9AGAM|nr:hypothetical protein K488DRAFT_41187 [Vararia minispora EC-137]
MDSLQALADVLTALSENPLDISLHIQHISLAEHAGDEQATEAREMMTAYWAVGDEVWMPLIDAKAHAVDVDTVAGAQEVHELYKRAEGDYLSVPLLKAHAEFVIARHAHFVETDAELGENGAFTASWTRSALENIVQNATKHTAEGNAVWMLYRDWEIEVLEAASADEKEVLVMNIDEMHLERIKQPHAGHDETFQSYSTFTTNHKPSQQYEMLLVEASKLRSKVSKAYEFREQYETTLATTGYALTAYAEYIAYERRAKKPDFIFLAGVYERAIAEAAKRRFKGEVSAEEALRAFWLGYIDALRIHRGDEDSQLAVLRRACRSIPGSGELWSKYIRFLEAYPELSDTGIAETASTIYDRAFATKLFEKEPEEIVPIVLARAGYEKPNRRFVETRQLINYCLLSADADAAVPILFGVLEEGLDRIRKASKTGDPRYRIERFLADLHKDLGKPDEAAEVWGKAAKHSKTNYTPWIAYAETLMLSDNFSMADSALSKASATPNMDWPEAIWETWITLQHSHGTLNSLNKCLDSVEWERQKVNAKRARAAYEAQQTVQQQQAAEAFLNDVVLSEGAQNSAADGGEAPMAVDYPATTQPSLKRKAQDSLVSEEAVKKAKPGKQPKDFHAREDRENCTVFVRNLPPNTTDAELTALFKDCGSIREIKVTPLPSALVATVEFVDTDSVPAALTKDKKRIRGEEIAVHLAWQSTLYVTNFPESADDTSMREMFGKYGQLFDVRWPSKKFKSSRRFCYVQYTSPNEAKEALMLHGIELEPGMKLNVYISNPERKKERTDASADAKEIYVAGLSKFTTKEDLEKRFLTYGPIKEIRIPLDEEKKYSKGFAFIEFKNEADAIKALGANNQDLKSRRIAVTLADTRIKGHKKEPDSGMGRKADAQSRSLRARGLPLTERDVSTMEELLQETFAKHAPVRRVEVFTQKNEAVIEFESAADAAKLLLLSDQVIFDGEPLKLSDDVDALAAGSSVFVPRKAMSRPRAGIRTVRNPAAPVSASTSAPAGMPRAGKASQDDFRKMLFGGK